MVCVSNEKEGQDMGASCCTTYSLAGRTPDSPYLLYLPTDAYTCIDILHIPTHRYIPIYVTYIHVHG